ncbi:MAG TPA: glycosyltransferase, partial [Candidatus Limnocylindrales bacterium]|nr:glycosyltransferase [Candidatus Limnocylindrales bacterium]
MTGTAARPRVAYVMSRFPKLTETFVVAEILGMEAAGVDVSIHPLLRYREPVVQPDAARLAGLVRYLPFVSRAIVRANLRALRRAPRRYLGTLAAVVAGTAGSRNYLVRGLALFPKIVLMAERMQAARVEHVHCHFSSHPAVAGFVIGRLTGIPWSFTAHGSDLHVDRHMLCDKVREAAFVVAISEDNRRVITGTCGADAAPRVRVIHTGVDTAAFPVVDRPDDGRLSILCIGTLHEVKGQRHLIDACRRLREAGVDFECRLVGEGQDREMLEERIRDAGLQDLVTLLGARTRDEIIELLGTS